MEYTLGRRALMLNMAFLGAGLQGRVATSIWDPVALKIDHEMKKKHENSIVPVRKGIVCKYGLATVCGSD